MFAGVTLVVSGVIAALTRPFARPLRPGTAYDVAVQGGMATLELPATQEPAWHLLIVANLARAPLPQQVPIRLESSQARGAAPWRTAGFDGPNLRGAVGNCQLSGPHVVALDLRGAQPAVRFMLAGTAAKFLHLRTRAGRGARLQVTLVPLSGT